MPHSEIKDSGASGAEKQGSRFTPVSIASLPEMPTVPQKVKFFTARNTFIAESSLEEIAAIDFDAWIIQLFGAIEDIDREAWEMADRLYALNSALDQMASRRENGQIYVRLDALPDGKMQLSLIEPVEPDEEGEPAIKSEPDFLERVARAREIMRDNPGMNSAELAQALGLKSKLYARQVKVFVNATTPPGEGA